MMRAVSVMDYGGGFRVGANRAGVSTVAKLEMGDRWGRLSAETVQLNMETPTVSCGPADWPLQQLHDEGVDLVYGNPPCAGFSSKGLGAGAAHGASEMWRQFARAAAVLQPTWTVLESVESAFRREDGRALLRELRDTIDPRATLHYVIVSAGEVGSPQKPRRRCFAVFTRAPFAPDFSPVLVPTVRSVLRGVDPGETVVASAYEMLARWQAAGLEPYVKPGPVAPQGPALLQRYVAAGGDRDVFAYPHLMRRIESGEPVSQNGFDVFRLGWDTYSSTVLRDAYIRTIHPGAPLRYLTVAEMAALMGFPRGWKLATSTRAPLLHGSLVANGVTVQAGEWVLSQLSCTDGNAAALVLADGEVAWCSPWRKTKPWHAIARAEALDAAAAARDTASTRSSALAPAML